MAAPLSISSRWRRNRRAQKRKAHASGIEPAEILNGEGFEAMAVSTGTSAIELAKAFDPDVVLSDVIMPGLNGIETGIRIRKIAPNCRVILFSGQAATVDLLEEARQQGHRFDILAKPIRPEQLISAVRASSR